MTPTLAQLKDETGEKLLALKNAANDTKRSMSATEIGRDIILLVTQYKKLIDAKTSNLNSRAVLYSGINRMVVKLFGNDFYACSIAILKLTAAEMATLKGMQATSANNKNQSRIVINGELYHHLIQVLKDSNRISDLGVCLSLATGRRPTEIATTAKFERHGAHSVLFTGQLKKRNEEDSRAYPIPVLVLKPDEAIAVLQRLRKKQAETHYSPVGFAAAINRTLKTAFGPRVNAETIRGAYATICYRIYSQLSLPESLYDAQILGHGTKAKPDGTVSTQHYQRTEVIRWPNAPLPELFLSPADREKRFKQFAKEK